MRPRRLVLFSVFSLPAAALIVAAAWSDAASPPATKPAGSSGAKAAPAARFPLLPNDSRSWSRSADAKLLTDFAQALPPSALTTGRREKGKWKVVSYATDAYEGNALSCLRATEAAPVRMPLDAQGPHAVYVGLCTTSGGLDAADENGIEVKLSGEPVYRRVSNTLPLLKPRRDQIHETFLTVADLTGQALDIRALPYLPSTICYVKLVPLTAEEFAAWRKPVDPKLRTAIATFDGHSWIWPYRPRTADDLRATFRGLERSDVGKWWFQICGADLTCYPSAVGTNPGDGTEDFCRWEYRDYSESLAAMFQAGVNPLHVAREEAARQGAEFHVMIRPAGWGASYPWEEIFNSKFFHEHPEWRCIDRDGTPTLHMSWAYPEVRRHVIDVLQETLAIQPDGIGFLFHRGMPMILWEEPFCEEFRKRYGANAREVPEDDPRILDLRAEMMTTILREWRTLLDETAARQKRTRPYKITLATFAKEADNRRWGIDVVRWARDGLVDEVGPAYFAHHTSFVQPDVAYYKQALAGTKVGLYPLVIAWHSGSPQQLCTRVTGFYQAGADGICVWDPTIEKGYRDKSPGHVYDVVQVLGHRDVMADWAAHGVPLPVITPLKRFGENHYSRFFPNTGY